MKRVFCITIIMIIIMSTSVRSYATTTAIPFIPVDVTGILQDLAQKMGINVEEITITKLQEIKQTLSDNDELNKYINYLNIVLGVFNVTALQGSTAVIWDDVALNNFSNEQNVIATSYNQFTTNNDNMMLEYLKEQAITVSLKQQFYKWYRESFKYDNNTGNYIITTKNYNFNATSFYYIDNICPTFEDTFKYVPQEYLQLYEEFQDEFRALTTQIVGAMTFNNIQSGETVTGFFKDYPHVILKGYDYSSKFVLYKYSDTRAELYYASDFTEMKVIKKGTLWTISGATIYRRDIYFDNSIVTSVSGNVVDNSLSNQTFFNYEYVYSNYDFYDSYYGGAPLYNYDVGETMPTIITIPDTILVNDNLGTITIDTTDAVARTTIDVPLAYDENDEPYVENIPSSVTTDIPVEETGYASENDLTKSIAEDVADLNDDMNNKNNENKKHQIGFDDLIQKLKDKLGLFYQLKEFLEAITNIQYSGQKPVFEIDLSKLYDNATGTASIIDFTFYDSYRDYIFLFIRVIAWFTFIKKTYKRIPTMLTT